MSFFDDLNLDERLLKSLNKAGYDTPTPIQQQAIPSLLEGRDLCGIAQTGTGKTAAFSLPSLHRLMQNPRPTPIKSCRLLVLSPTRELAAQIADNIRKYGRNARFSIETVFGGVPIGRQINKLAAGADIVVATPGRLLDLIDQRAFSLRDVEIFVLDEADQMMDMGFIHSLRRIDKMLPKERQTLFFSATMPPEIETLARGFLTDPIKVSVAPPATTAERVEQFAIFVNQSEKQALLTVMLQDTEIERAIVFMRTKHGADRVVRFLNAAGIACAAIHGNKSQAQRTTALQGFRDGRTPILIATDIAARGIDVSGLSHVFNFEMPNVAEQYVHRIGRTGRAGKEGMAISFIAPDEKAYLKAIERLTGSRLMPLPLPENFAQRAGQLPKPAAPRDDDNRRDRRSSGPRGDAGAPRGAGSRGRPGGERNGRGRPFAAGGDDRTRPAPAREGGDDRATYRSEMRADDRGARAAQGADGERRARPTNSRSAYADNAQGRTGGERRSPATARTDSGEGRGRTPRRADGDGAARGGAQKAGDGRSRGAPYASGDGRRQERGPGGNGGAGARGRARPTADSAGERPARPSRPRSAKPRTDAVKPFRPGRG